MTSDDTRKLYQTVADAIGKAINEGHYAPGQKLPSERELTEAFEVSRPTVREAMIALEIRGLVEARRNAGMFVASAFPAQAHEPDLDIGAFELTEARKIIESEAVALAAKTITPSEIAELETCLSDMRRDFSIDVTNDASEKRFHLIVGRATRNPALAYVIESLWDMRHKALLTREIFRRAREVGISDVTEDHKIIIEALKIGDSAGARLAMQRHLTNVMDELLDATEIELVQKAKEEVGKRRRELLQRTVL